MTVQISARDDTWHPHPIDELQREMERFFDHVQRGKRPRVVFSEQAWSPPVDVYEADGQLIVLADLAGVAKERIEIEVENGQLHLRGERRLQHRGDERTVHSLEVPYGAFERRIPLPFPVESSRAEATYRDGFLEIVLPRVEPREPRRVPIRTTPPQAG